MVVSCRVVGAALLLVVERVDGIAVHVRW